MDDTAIDVVTTYYDILEAFDPDRLRGILAPDLVFEGPIAGSVVGAEPFIGGVTGFARTMAGITPLHRLASGDQVASLYDAAMPGGSVRFAEFFEVADGRIRTLRLLYDAGDYVAKGGR